MSWASRGQRPRLQYSGVDAPPGSQRRCNVCGGPRYRRRLQRGVHKHLRRLERIWIHDPIYFVTTCMYWRKPILADKDVAAILMHEWQSARRSVPM